MKLLRDGAPWTVTLTCNSCKSLLLVEDTDITLEQAPVTDYGVLCCKCIKCNTYLNIGEVPAYVQQMAEKKATWNVGQPLH